MSPPDPVNDPLESVGAASETSIRGREGAMAAAEMNRRFGNDHAGGRKFCQHALHTFIGPTQESRRYLQAQRSSSFESS